MSQPFSPTGTRRRFPRAILAATLAASLLAACGGDDDDDNNSSRPPEAGVPPVTTPPVTTSPVTDTPVTERTFLPNAGTLHGSADASTAIALDANWMVVADDEANVLRVYPRQGGAAVLEWDFSSKVRRCPRNWTSKPAP